MPKAKRRCISKLSAEEQKLPLKMKRSEGQAAEILVPMFPLTDPGGPVWRIPGSLASPAAKARRFLPLWQGLAEGAEAALRRRRFQLPAAWAFLAGAEAEVGAAAGPETEPIGKKKSRENIGRLGGAW